MKRIVCILLTLSLFASYSTKAQVKDSTVTAVYTDYKTYWTSNTTKNSTTLPDTSHNLLAFTFRGKTYSTGVNNAMLNTKLGSSNYSAQIYKALPVKNIEGQVVAGGATNLAFGLKNDGDSTKAAYKSPYPNIHIADVLTDGKNGLDLGTGVTNLPKGGHISFIIKNLTTRAVTDTVPDFIFTQIAEPTTNQPDTIFFFDKDNSLVGSKKLVYWNSVSKLGTYKLDLYTLTSGVSCNTSIMNGLFEQNGTRDIRMVAFLLSEFGIGTSNAGQIKGIQINPSGSSDQAFIAYNVNTVNLEVPVITAQPATQTFCSPEATSSVTFRVTASSNTLLTYQWKKDGEAIDGATSSSYTATGLTSADTANAYSVTVTNNIGSIASDNAYVKYIIAAQPASQYLATGNAASFNIQTPSATAWQWQKNGSNISGATSVSYAMSVVNYADSGSYKALVTYSGGTCTSNAAVLKTSIILYSKSTGNLNLPATWGVATDGSGSSPVNFTRDEHTFFVANRVAAETGADLTIAGRLDLSNGKVTITPGTTLTAGRITRLAQATGLSSTGVLVSSATSNLSVTGIATATYTGASDLYFDAIYDTIKNLTTSNHSVTLRSLLNITAGKNPGVLQVNSGTFTTSDALTLKSDINGTASIAQSAGTISGKITIERFIHARRAWRLIGAPVTLTNAPTINASWQEGATGSSANPNPGFGTHITYGAESDGFDQNPQKTFSVRVRNSSAAWVGIPATNKTLITDYPAYFIFIRGNRSYDILSTTNVTTPTTTILRVTGNVNQGIQAAKPIAASGLTLVANPYACPVSFASIVNSSSNLKKRIRVWDPTLAGAKGVGAWVILDGTSGTYKATPSSVSVSALLQAGQGFFVESSDGVNNGSMVINESAKDATGNTISSDRIGEADTDTSLAINLKLFNNDSTTAIADGVLFNFNTANNDSIDNNDATKMNNFGENLAIKESSLLSISDRTLPLAGDSLRLNFTSAKNASYQFEVVPSSMSNQLLSLYDKYLNTFSPISSTDTTRITFSVNTAVEASKASDRFTIVVLKSKMKPAATATVINVKAYAKDKAINVDFTTANQSNIAYYEVQKSVDGSSFSFAGTVATNSTGVYSFTDAKPSAGVNYYRVKSISKTGDILYSNSVAAQLAGVSATGASSIGVYPNPLTGTTFTLTLTNLAAGSYTLSVVNSNGAVQFSKGISHNGGTASQKISLNHTLAAGIYYIKVAAENGAAHVVKISAQ